ncbi:3-phosphoglycerate dehydrogenase [Spirochaetia bacterium]|nr:3-phosphoglycerate dehydrogenase [Spirochaetia bacterium]
MQKEIILVSLSPERLPPNAVERLQAAGEGRKVLVTLDNAEVEQALDRIEIAIGDIPVELLSRMPRLRWVQLWSAGADRFQGFPELKEKPFVITTTSGIHGQQIAEHTFAMLLSWNRNFPAAFAARKNHEWLQISGSQTSTLQGKAMLILGYGAIGEAIARIALAFGMKVTGLRRTLSKGGAIPGVTLKSSDKLRELLPSADHVVNILPSTPDTYHLFGAVEFNLMKRTALYINVGRGATTDEAALIDALKSKRIAGALLDVTEMEPLPAGSPLWALDNVILSAHYAGMHPDYGALALEVALENLDRYIHSRALRNVVDKNAGY